MKKFLLLFLLVLLLPYFVFAASPQTPHSAKVNKINIKKIPKNSGIKKTSNAAMKILSFTCTASSTGDWILLYESMNPGLVNFAPHKLQYKLTQILRNGRRNPIHITSNRRSFLHGTRMSEHSSWDRCSLATKLELEISYQNKVLDKKIINIPPMNVKIIRAYGLNGRFNAVLRNNTSYIARIGVRTIAMTNLNHSSLAAVGGDRLLGPEIQVIIPAKTTKTCSGRIVKGGKNTSLRVVFKDERKCAGKGYIVLASKILEHGNKSDLGNSLKSKVLNNNAKKTVPGRIHPKKKSNKLTKDLPAGLKNGPVK